MSASDVNGVVSGRPLTKSDVCMELKAYVDRYRQEGGEAVVNVSKALKDLESSGDNKRALVILQRWRDAPLGECNLTVAQLTQFSKYESIQQIIDEFESSPQKREMAMAQHCHCLILALNSS